MKAYHIKDWNTIYETAQTRQVRTLTYFSKPNKLVGECVGHMLNQEDGLALYGVWTFLEALASTAPTEHRGWLVRNGTPMDAVRISALTRIPAAAIQRALDFFSTTPMDWLEVLDFQPVKPVEISTPSARHQSTDGTPSARHQSTDGTPSARHQSTDGISVRGKTDKEKEGRDLRERDNKDASPEKSKLQWAATAKQIKALEDLGSSATVADKQRLRKLRATLREIETKQAAGDFTPVQTSGGTP